MRALILLSVLAACGSPHAQSPADATTSPDGAIVPDAPADAAPDGAPDAGPPADPFVAIQKLPGICTSTGWCWRIPTPTGNDYDNVFATDPNNVWLTGWDLALQWTGQAWISHHLPVLTDLPEGQRVFAIGGTAATNMWLVYGSALEHWDGTAWTIVESQPLGGNPAYGTIWVAPDTGDAWVTISTGHVEHFHGTTKIDDLVACNCFLGKIWGTSSTDIYLTSIGRQLHYNGTSFSIINSVGTFAGWQGAPGDVWVGGVGALAHYDGTTFQTVALPPGITTAQALIPVGYTSSTDVTWLVPDTTMLHWDGTQITATTLAGPELSVLSAQIVAGTWWIAGRQSSLSTLTGTTLTPVLAPQWDLLHGMWATSDHDIYLATDGDLRHFDGTTMTLLTPAMGVNTATFDEVTSVVGLQTGGVDELWVTTQEESADGGYATGTYHFDGTTWARQIIETGTRDQLVGLGVVTIAGPGEAWAFNASGKSWHFTGGSWQSFATTALAQPFTHVWAPDATHAWIVGAGRELVTWDAINPSVFTAVAIPASPCTDPSGNPMELGQVIGVGGFPWIPSSESCKGVAAMWELTASGWTEVLEQVLGNGSIFQINPVTEAANEQGGLISISSTNLIFSNAGNSSTWRFDGTVWNFEDTGSEFATPTVFEAADGPTFISSFDHGVLSHP